MSVSKKKFSAYLATMVVAASLMTSTTPTMAVAAESDVCASLPKTTTETDGIPGPIFWKRMQCLGSMPSERPYTYKIDGVMGPNSWLGVSARLKVGKYHAGPISNGNSPANILALQKWALDHNRPIWHTGHWNVPTYQAVAWCLNRSF